ncbi:MAG: dihydrodipicolinate synthase family protein [Planctomycetota bacterium]|jgi:4-hydroxy-tetrahydrodipicolinate synthase
MAADFDLTSLHTVHLVPLTAYNADGSLNLDLQKAHSARMYEAGMRCFLPAAGTSEFHSLSADEVVDIVAATCEATGPDAVVFAPVGLQVGHAVEIAKRSLDAGATGIMFMPFSHPYMSDVGAKAYYRAVMDAAPCPTLVYKKAPLPSNALLLEMASHPSVVGVKYAWNQMHEFRTTVAADSEGIEWLCGSAERFAPYYFLAGSHGYTTGAGNVAPHLTLAMHAAFAAGEYDEGMQYQAQLLPIEDYRAREGDSFNISMLKHAMHSLSQDFGPPRAPQRELTDGERAEVDALIKPIIEADRQIAEELASVGLSS